MLSRVAVESKLAFVCLLLVIAIDNISSFETAYRAFVCIHKTWVLDFFVLVCSYFIYLAKVYLYFFGCAKLEPVSEHRSINKTINEPKARTHRNGKERFYARLNGKHSKCDDRKIDAKRILH